MRAMILAAGLGTRLRPHTRYRPKPLFTIGGQTVLDRLIGQLAGAGCLGVVINTHHLADHIRTHVQQRTYPIAVNLIHETEILGTGGGIRNAAPWLDEAPFLVINGDVATDIELDAVYRFHLEHSDPVTMVLVDYPPVNSVCYNEALKVTGFIDRPGHEAAQLTNGLRRATFSGIQVLDPEVFDYLPQQGFHSIVDTYRQMLARQRPIRAYLPQEARWWDIGTPRRYLAAVFDHMAPRAFESAFGRPVRAPIDRKRLAGDGSQRLWERLQCNGHSLILGDHGIRSQPGVQEVDAYIDIGRHLRHQSVAVPEIYAADRQAGFVFCEDLGDVNLQDFVRAQSGQPPIEAIYRRVINRLARLAFNGPDGFKTTWTCQSTHYDRDLIIEKECRYFLDAFINGYLDRRENPDDYQADFETLAKAALKCQVPGLMHRDMQARNIMLRNGREPVFIDFQGARLGPVQYDLSSLIIDPYSALDESLQAALFQYAKERYTPHHPAGDDHFEKGFLYCCLTRNLQILGAFAHLSQRCGKTQFEAYIPRALWQLKRSIRRLPDDRLPTLQRLVRSL